MLAALASRNTFSSIRPVSITLEMIQVFGLEAGEESLTTIS